MLFFQTLAWVSGVLELSTPRDAFITALCKSCLPPHYTLTVLNNSSQSSLSHGGAATTTNNSSPPNSASAATGSRQQHQQQIHQHYYDSEVGASCIIGWMNVIWWLLWSVMVYWKKLNVSNTWCRMEGERINWEGWVHGTSEEKQAWEALKWVLRNRGLGVGRKRCKLFCQLGCQWQKLVHETCG